MNLLDIISQYNASSPLNNASTPPSAWYTNNEIFDLEFNSVFSQNWLVAARIEQLQNDGDYVATEIAGQPIVLTKSNEINAFYNVCQHHAAQVMATGSGCTKLMTCPYHGWGYKLDGSLFSTPKFDCVENFDKSHHGLKPIRVQTWLKWVFVCFDEDTPKLNTFLGSLTEQIENLNIEHLTFYKRASYEMHCNWKVYVDNYLDGGYHVQFLHKGLSSALDNRQYKIEITDRFCLQSCPTKERENEFSQVRKGMARYYWQYPNLMLNLYDGILGTMIVEPLAVDKCRVIFDYYFDDEHPNITDEFKHHSVTVADKVQEEDADVCMSVQQGLNSRGYETGRLSVEKEAGEHLFHRLLYKDMFNSLVSKDLHIPTVD